MVERACGMQAGEGEQGVGQQLVDFLCRMKDGGIRGDAKIQLEDAIVEQPAVPDPRHDTDNWNDEHEDVEQVMHEKRRAAVELADVRRKVRRLVLGAPEEPRDNQNRID